MLFQVLRLIVSVGIFHCKGAVLSTKTSKTFVSVGILHCKGVVSSPEAFCVRRDLALQGCCFKHYDVFWCP